MAYVYGKPEYWDERYSSNAEDFDWYHRFVGLKDVLAPILKPEQQILHVGSGNSRLSDELFEEGFINSTNIDISPAVTRYM
jgi:ubiquinone/menaquinone biosynthesis C-methylase UbiE